MEKLGKRVEKKGGKVLEVGVSPSVYIKNWHFSTHIPLPPKKIAKGWKTIFVPLFSKGWKKGGSTLFSTLIEPKQCTELCK